MKQFKDPSVLEYLGKHDGGILVLVSLICDDITYDSTFFYNAENILLTIPEELELLIGDITKHEDYIDIIKTILKKIVPYSEMYNRIDDIDFNKWISGEIEYETEEEAEEIDNSEIKESDKDNTSDQ